MKKITRVAALEAFEKIRKESVADITLDEINAEIDEARRARIAEKAMPGAPLKK